MDAEMGDSLDKYWEETQRYIEYEELRYEYERTKSARQRYNTMRRLTAGRGFIHSVDGCSIYLEAQEDAMSCYDSSSPDGSNSHSSPAPAGAGQGRAMDKASIIKDAIEYIQQLQSEERQRGAVRSAPAPPPPVELLELRVSEVGDRVLVVSVTCSKRRDAMAKVCRAIEELRLRIITANITAVAGCLMHTVFVEEDKIDRIQMKNMIEAALTQLDAIGSPPSSMSY
ncbi:unnamed protein product [Miscanthus lutarioriparius]|uniref:Plant bHLH transcription factor ACT-like domain-containing protein n=1 Tax=Miscanthus lutarioriparius TaxID=422564 RepID=A0A811R2S8_9POAL|nr:unnamed protein product [Miscanthus lutarioriparius]